MENLIGKIGKGHFLKSVLRGHKVKEVRLRNVMEMVWNPPHTTHLMNNFGKTLPTYKCELFFCRFRLGHGFQGAPSTAHTVH
jgi:hypothetical protein